MIFKNLNFNTLKSLSNNKLIFKNFSFLSALYFVNLIAPLITYPYLIKVIGTEKFGLVVFTQTIVNILSILIGFGFSVVGVREVSLNRNDKAKLSEIISISLIIKALLFLITLLISFIISFQFQILDENRTLFLLSFWVCLNDILFPLWYFQGLEKMNQIAYLATFSKILGVLLIFTFVNRDGHFIRIPLVYGLGTIIPNIIALYIIFIKHGNKLFFPDIRIINQYFHEAKNYMFSNIIVALKEKGNVLMIGSLISLNEVTYYDLAMKVIELIRAPFLVMKDALFPSVVAEGRFKKLIQFGRSSLIISGISIFLIFQFSEIIIRLLGNSEMEPASDILKTVSFLIPLYIISMYLGVGLIILKKNKDYLKSTTYSLFIYLLAILIFWGLDEITINRIIAALYIGTISDIFLRLVFIRNLNENNETVI